MSEEQKKEIAAHLSKIKVLENQNRTLGIELEVKTKQLNVTKFKLEESNHARDDAIVRMNLAQEYSATLEEQLKTV